MSDEKPVKHVIRDRLRSMGVAYAVITVALFLVAIYARSAGALIAAGVAAIFVVLYFIVNERNAKKND